MQLKRVKDWILEFDEYAFNFIIDTNTKESRTGIIIDEFGTWHKTDGMTEPEAIAYRKKGFVPFVPDLIDFKNKLIIEWQEEPKTGRGASLGKKGHDEFNDENKDLYYKLGGFNQLKLWENTPLEESKQQLIEFLTNS